MSTYTPIATQTLGTTTSSVTFSSIPQGYTDLVLVISAKNTTGQNYETWLRFNGDSTSSYSQTFLQNYDGSTQAGRNANITEIRTGKMNTTSFDANIIHINSYSNSTTYKTTLSRHNNAQFVTGAMVGTWRNTNAITRIDAICESGANYASGSTFTLYGIQTGNRLAKADGGTTVTTDGTYWYHTFRSSGAFIPNQALTNVDYLVVAGGGGGSGANGGADAGNGGGGAGGLRSTITQTGGNSAGVNLESKLSLSSGVSYPVIIGAGGTGGAGGVGTTDGFNGLDSVFHTITSVGGSGGNDYGGSATTTGGSGGGAGAGTANRSLGTANQGFDGGTSSGNSGGGGGGAGAAGGAASGNTGGTGGSGIALSISGSSVTYAGGGGGGGKSTGGSATGGGGAGGSGNNNGTAGTTNLGGGGGGAGGVLSSGTNVGGRGGSGIVIIRYAV
jgi:hypothetical protein